MLGKGWLAVLALSLAITAPAAVRIAEAYASDANAAAIQPALGEPFYLTVNLDSDQAGEAFTLAFTAISGNRQSSTFTTPGGPCHLTWGPFTALMEGPMTIGVKDLETGAMTSIIVTPALPTSAIERFSPLANQATFSATWSGSTTGAKWWIPVIPLGPFQTPTSTFEPGVPTVASTTGQQVSVAAGSSSVESDVAFTGWSARSNSTILRAISYPQITAAETAMKPWLASETYVEVGNSAIKNLVTATLGKNFKARMSPYDAARALFLATIRKLHFVPYSYAPDAIQALKRGSGDCGSFSSVFVALCRAAGIPARAACGFTAGVDQWHVWTEFWLPGAGWIPADPAYASGLRPQGDLPIYFGVIPDLNRRLVTSYGFDRAIGRLKTPMLQSPALSLPNTKTTGTLTAHSSL